jgi:RNA polymerase sigma factor (sigma-70 family)
VPDRQEVEVNTASVASSAGHRRHGQTPADVEDADLVRLAMAGDAVAWRELVRRKDALIRTVCRNCGLDAADVADVVQTTWLQLARTITRLKSPDSIAPWLVVTARNESMRVARRNRRRAETSVRVANDPLRDRPDDSDGPSRVELTLESFDAVRSAFERLAPRQRRVLELALKGQSYRAIAQTVDMPLGSIGPTRQRAIEQLRRAPQVARLLAS